MNFDSMAVGNYIVKYQEFVHSLIGRMAELWWIINKGVEREPVLTLRLCY